MPSFLVVRLGALGDIVHALPLAAALREHWPGGTVDWVVERRHRALLDLVTGLDAVITFDSRALAASEGWIGVARRLRERHYDVVFDAQGLMKSAALARAAGGTRTIGFAREHLREPLARALYSEVVTPAGARHVVDKNLSLLGAVGVAPGRPAFPFREDPPGEAVLAAIGEAGRPFAVINPGGGWPNKRWPPERFGAVAASLRERHGLSSLVLWGPGDRTLADEVVAAAHGIARLAPPTSLPDVLALLRHASLVVSGDTGPLHLAAAVGTPVVGVYGPTDPARNGPWAADDVCVSRHDVCECFHLRRCRAARWCLDSVTPHEVAEAVERRLAVRA
jgi:lipopolysaccharide heptosyltransferase I